MLTLSGSEAISKGLAGAALLGSLSVEQGAALLMGNFDVEFLALAAIKIQGTLKEEYHIGEQENAFLDRVKNMVRNDFKSIFKMAEQQEMAELKKKAKEAMDKQHKPSEFGTVTELMAKLGLSKSEVRRRKADGTIEQLLKDKGLL